MTLNEVNIIKNSVLDATEAYVDARLAVADFVKTQIGVVIEGIQNPTTKKWVHKVRCNATQANPTGVVYSNVLSVNNIHFTNGSVVFIIAPNAQFSNQFILGKLDNVPYDITAGSIHIGQIGSSDEYYFNVDSVGNLNINNNQFTVSNAGVVTIKNGSILLGATTVSGVTGYNVNVDSNGLHLGFLGTNNYNFSVNNNGVTTIKNGSINLNYNSTVNDYGFIVDSNGIKLGVTGTSSSNKDWNFKVTNSGEITIKSGKINLNYNSTVNDYGFIVDSNGIKLGVTGTSSSNKDWNFKVSNAGEVTIKSGSITLGTNKLHIDSQGWLAIGGINNNAPFYVSNAGVVTIKNGSILLGENGTNYNININSTGIGVGWNGTNHNFTVSASDGSVSITKGSIDIKNKFHVDPSGWLSVGGTDNTANFYVDTSGNLTAKSLTANVGGNIAGFEISSSGLTKTGTNNDVAEIKSNIFRVSKWSSPRKYSIALDADTPRVVVNSSSSSYGSIIVSNVEAWNSSGGLNNPESGSNYTKLTPLALQMKGNGAVYGFGIDVVKMLDQSQSVGSIGDLRIMVGSASIAFTNVTSGKSGYIDLS